MAITVFDYALNFVWDIKVHTEVQIYMDSGPKQVRNETLLNDARATRACALTRAWDSSSSVAAR